jgi:hypothetical protein
VFAALGIGSLILLIDQLSRQEDRYDAFAAAQIRARDDARLLQVSFKKQVQEWKDILLRGADPQQLAKYRAQFDEQETATDR